MDILQIIVLVLYVTHVYSKSRKKYDSSLEDETIENLLYYKDCQKKPRVVTNSPSPVPLRLTAPPPPPPPPQPECPFPKMCCALSCGNDCGANMENPMITRQMEPIQRQHFQPFAPMTHSSNTAKQPAMVQTPLKKRKRPKFSSPKAQSPIASRRDFGFTKEKIKSLISQDDDIKKILKDLVRVTMQKANLLGTNDRGPEEPPDDNLQTHNDPPEERPPDFADDDDGYVE